RKVAGVFIEQVVNALLEAASHHGIGLSVHAHGEGLKRALPHLRFVDLPVVPAPDTCGGLKADIRNRVVEGLLERSKQFGIADKIAEMLVEDARRSPASARIPRA